VRKIRKDQHQKISMIDKPGVGVVKTKGESNEALLRRFRKKFSKSGIMRELREKMYYEKPSDKRRRKLAQSIRKQQKDEEKLQKLQERRAKFQKKKRKENRKYAKHSGSNRQDRGENSEGRDD
jgi:small subunit ribosomal protein S21